MSEYKSGVTVVVPVYNAEKTLNKCVESILCQTYKNFYIILVDDGSTDNSPAICDEYANEHKNISVLHIENKGVSNARNTGIYAVKTEYFVCVDSDDYVEPDYLQILIDAKEKFPDAGHFWCCLQSVTPSGEVIHRYIANDSEEYSVFDKTQIMTLAEKVIMQCPYCKLNKTSVVHSNGIKMNTQFSLGEDMMFNLDCIEASGIGKIVVINKTPYNYLIGNENSLDNKYRADLLTITKHLKDYTKAYLDKWQVEKEQYDLFWNSYFSAMMNVLTNTMNKSNKASYKKKIEYNNKILRSDLFGQILEKRNCYVNPILLKALRSGDYRKVMRFEKTARLKNKFISRRTK